MTASALYDGARFYASTFLLTALFTLPYACFQFMQPLPLYVTLPLLPFSEGLHYMAVLVHESSHALADYFFGYPALPVFDVAKGGGSTYRWQHSGTLLTVLDSALALAAIYAFRKRRHDMGLAIMAVMAVQFFVLAMKLDEAVIIFMGHGGEVIAGAALLARHPHLPRRIERGIALLFGTYLFLRIVFIATALLWLPERRESYSMQKGIPGSGDFTKLAETLNIPLEAVAAGFLGYVAIAVVVTVILLRRQPPQAHPLQKL